MNINGQPIALPALQWLFNTPYHCQLNGKEIKSFKEYAKKSKPLRITFTDGEVMDMPHYLILESATPSQNTIHLKDNKGSSFLLRYYDLKTNRVLVQQVLDYVRDNQRYGMNMSKYLSMAIAVCNGAPIAAVAQQWHLGESYVKVLIEHLGLRLTILSKKHPHLTPIISQMSASRLKHYSDYWIKTLEEYKPYLKDAE
ncbi:MAG: hypothetical protein PHQ58_04755 [Rhodoferax sp.]|uniref:hypothetical protein n=1 Tax=Rhodoferax sp. TaxID=50421 RepID=UPI00261230A4|nr:hypothetical protein [Rhodoferax sp.]MDD2879723.1 hypothetical protein [Rhodoferax sp.]